MDGVLSSILSTNIWQVSCFEQWSGIHIWWSIKGWRHHFCVFFAPCLILIGWITLGWYLFSLSCSQMELPSEVKTKKMPSMFKCNVYFVVLVWLSKKSQWFVCANVSRHLFLFFDFLLSQFLLLIKVGESSLLWQNFQLIISEKYKLYSHQCKKISEKN